MLKKIGIRREDKNKWEARAPLTPRHVEELTQKYPIEFMIQPSTIRKFSDDDYKKAGAIISEDLSPCPVIFGIKEIPGAFFEENKTYVFFSHTIKGQDYNMPMLKRILELKCQLIDYERIIDGNGKRLLFFGRHAGLAGMIDTLWALGQRLKWEGMDNPFSDIQMTHQYQDLEAARRSIAKVAENIKTSGLAGELTPMVCGFMGYGNVSKGAQEILDLLPVEEINPGQLLTLNQNCNFSRKKIYKVVFKEGDMVEPVEKGVEFNLQEYYRYPERYRSRFDRYLPHLTLLVNCVYWDKRYPKFVTKHYLKELYSQGKPCLRVIGDLSCDVAGAIECNLKITTPENPVYVYEPEKYTIHTGVAGNGPIILAIDNLPCELPLESSRDFGDILQDFVPAIAAADYSKSFANIDLPVSVKKAIIVFKGVLTPDYQYIKKFL